MRPFSPLPTNQAPSSPTKALWTHHKSPEKCLEIEEGSFGMIRILICDPRSHGSWTTKGAVKSVLDKDALPPLMLWSEWSRITNPDPDHNTRTHPPHFSISLSAIKIERKKIKNALKSLLANGVSVNRPRCEYWVENFPKCLGSFEECVDLRGSQGPALPDHSWGGKGEGLCSPRYLPCRIKHVKQSPLYSPRVINSTWWAPGFVHFFRFSSKIRNLWDAD